MIAATGGGYHRKRSSRSLTCFRTFLTSLLGYLASDTWLQNVVNKQADDAILFHQFASIATQTMIRPEELLQLRRRNTWLSESSDYAANSGPIKLIEILSKGANKNSKTSRLLSWVVRNRELDHMCPWFWMAARLMHDYQRMLPGKDGGHYGSMVQVFKDRPTGDHTMLALYMAVLTVL